MRESAGQLMWDESRWTAVDHWAREFLSSRSAVSESDAWRLVSRICRVVMRRFTTGFFVASRFLPPAKREEVEAIYAAVRYPDEVVDTFPLTPAERLERLAAWESAYERGILSDSLKESLGKGMPVFLAGFCEVMRRHGIPAQHYRDFLSAMRRDVEPRPYATLEDLISSYVHGSAIVVGWFLTHAYGARAPRDFDAALDAARDLGIALQLTNFIRDVGEDHRRGRLYLPRDWLAAEGVRDPDPWDPAQRAAFEAVVWRVADEAARLYRRAAERVELFAPDCRPAIRACIAVYGQLNERIRRTPFVPGHRVRVPTREKWRVLPSRKWWVIPLSYLGAAWDDQWLQWALVRSSQSNHGRFVRDEAASSGA